MLEMLVLEIALKTDLGGIQGQTKVVLIHVFLVDRLSQTVMNPVVLDSRSQQSKEVYRDKAYLIMKDLRFIINL